MRLLLMLFLIGLTSTVKAQSKAPVVPKDSIASQVVEAACGQCQFKLPGKGCNLAVRIEGKAYFVDGTDIDDHGDAHAADGFCKAVRKAEVSGNVVEGRFKATSFELLPGDKKKH